MEEEVRGGGIGAWLQVALIKFNLAAHSSFFLPFFIFLSFFSPPFLVSSLWLSLSFVRSLIPPSIMPVGAGAQRQPPIMSSSATHWMPWSTVPTEP